MSILRQKNNRTDGFFDQYPCFQCLLINPPALGWWVFSPGIQFELGSQVATLHNLEYVKTISQRFYSVFSWVTGR